MRVRLAGGSSTVGRLEISLDNGATWGYIATDGTSEVGGAASFVCCCGPRALPECRSSASAAPLLQVRHHELAEVVCRQLNLPLPARLIGENIYGTATGTVW